MIAIHKAIATTLFGILLCLFSPDAALLAKNAVDYIALGHSSAKTLALMVFFLTTFLVARSAFPTPAKTVLKGFFVVWTTSALISFGEFLWYVHKTGLSLSEESRFMRHGFWSFTSITHIHTSKVLLSPLFGGLAGATDAGYPFQPLFSQYLIACHLLIFSLLLVLAFLCAVFAYRNSRFAVATTLVLCFFVLCKNAVDGGPFSPEVWATVPVLAGLLWGRRFCTAGALLLLCYLALAQRPWLDIVWRVPMNIFALTVPLLLESAHRRSLARLLSVLALSLTLYLSPLALRQIVTKFSWYPYALNILAYGHFALPQHYKVWVLTLHPEKVRSSDTLEILNETTSGPYTMFGVRLLKNSTPLKLCKELDLPAARYPVTWYPEEMELEVEVHLLEGNLSLETDSELLIDYHLQPGTPFSKLTLRLAPGVNDTSALALLGPELMVLRRTRFEPYKPKESEPNS